MPGRTHGCVAVCTAVRMASLSAQTTNKSNCQYQYCVHKFSRLTCMSKIGNCNYHMKLKLNSYPSFCLAFNSSIKCMFCNIWLEFSWEPCWPNRPRLCHSRQQVNMIACDMRDLAGLSLSTFESFFIKVRCQCWDVSTRCINADLFFFLAPNISNQLQKYWQQGLVVTCL